MAEGERKSSSLWTPNGLSISSILRTFSEQSESDRPFVPVVGGPRSFFLLLYAAVIISTSIEFFASQHIWYGSWDLYNTFVFSITGVFLFVGTIMLLSTLKKSPDDYKLPIPRTVLGMLGFLVFATSGLALAIAGPDIGGWAIPLSILLVYGFVALLIATRGIDHHDSLRLVLYGTGLVLMIMVPVHEAFGVARSKEGGFPLTLLNMVLLTAGMTCALIAVQSLVTREGYMGAWLLGSMGIFLIAFHEQIGIIASGTYSQYDRTLALIGISFSFLPLAVYIWRDRVYYFLWRRLKTTNTLIESGDYDGAMKQVDAALKQCARVGIDDRFALPSSLKADIHYRKKEYERARVYYENALKIDQKDSVSWSHMGNMWAFEGKQEQALSAFDKALEADPKNANAWNNKGTVYQTINMPEDAIICFNKAIDFDPDSFDAHINKARLLARLGHSNEALPHFQEALRLRPDSEATKEGLRREFYRGMCLDQINGWEQLGLDTSYLRQMLDKEPTNFVKKTKEYIANIVDQRTQLAVVPGMEHIDVNVAIKKILTATEGEGATIETLMEETGLDRHKIVLPIALLMETDHVHFKTSGTKQVYVSKGKAPERPPPPPEPKLTAEPETAVKAAKETAAKVQTIPVKCPGCGQVVKGDEAKCPTCDLPFETASFDCPLCGEEVPFSADTCPKCGAVFRRAPPIAEETPAEEAETKGGFWSKRQTKTKPRKRKKPKELKESKEPQPKKELPRRAVVSVDPTASILFFKKRKK